MNMMASRLGMALKKYLLYFSVADNGRVSKGLILCLVVLCFSGCSGKWSPFYYAGSGYMQVFVSAAVEIKIFKDQGKFDQLLKSRDDSGFPERLCSANELLDIDQGMLHDTCRVMMAYPLSSCDDTMGCLHFEFAPSVLQSRYLMSLIEDVLRNPCHGLIVGAAPKNNKWKFDSIWKGASAYVGCDSGRLGYSKVYLKFGDVVKMISVERNIGL